MSRPGRSTKQKATLQPSRPNSRAAARPRPVAPPVTKATLPRNPGGTSGCGFGCSRTAPAGRAAGRPPGGRFESEAGHESPKLGALPEARKPAASSVTPRPAVHWGMGRLLWVGISLVGAAAWGGIALHRGETISAAWLVLAAVGTYLVGYRF